MFLQPSYQTHTTYTTYMITIGEYIFYCFYTCLTISLICHVTILILVSFCNYGISYLFFSQLHYAKVFSTIHRYSHFQGSLISCSSHYKKFVLKQIEITCQTYKYLPFQNTIKRRMVCSFSYCVSIQSKLRNWCIHSCSSSTLYVNSLSYYVSRTLGSYFPFQLPGCHSPLHCRQNWNSRFFPLSTVSSLF